MKIKKLKNLLVVFFIVAITLISTTNQARAASQNKYAVIYLSKQTMYCYENEACIATIPISSGMPGYETPTGKFTVWAKEKKSYSYTYQCDMYYVCWISGYEIGIHEGNISQLFASHGCVRQGSYDAWWFYEKFAYIGMPVYINP